MSREYLEIIDKTTEAPDACSLTFEIPEELVSDFQYRAGQYVHLTANVGGEEIERSYSLSSAPTVDPSFQITVKKVSGGKLSPYLVDETKAGDRLKLSRPQGRFFQDESAAHHYMLFAAGSGVTPLYSILKAVLAREGRDRVSLVYASRNEESIIFGAGLYALSERYPDRLRVVHVLSRPKTDWRGPRGRITLEMLSEQLQHWAPECGLPEVSYLCGPDGFMAAVQEILMRRGLAHSRIRRETFSVSTGALPDVSSGARTLIAAEGSDSEAGACEVVEVEIGGDEAVLAPEPGESLLAAALRSGLDAPFSCREGTCLSCTCRIQGGAVAMIFPDMLTPDDLGAGVALACLSVPVTKRLRVSFDDV